MSGVEVLTGLYDAFVVKFQQYVHTGKLQAVMGARG
jgi:hypothetical protein